MDDLAEQNFTKHKLEQLNACQMYLQITTLAEITDHTGTELLPQAFLLSGSTCPKGLGNISSSTLQWPHVATPSPTCWRTWSTTLRTLYTGSRNGTQLQQSLGDWTLAYEQYRFWHWQLPDPNHLMFQHSPTANPRVGLQTQQRRMILKFSPTVSTNQRFRGPPVTPVDTTTGYVRLPVPPLPSQQSIPECPGHYSTIQKQFWASLHPWQQALFGSLRKARSTNTLWHLMQSKTKVMIVSDASVQKSGQSGFAWLVATHQTLLWRGVGLAPGPAEDTYSGRAKAYGLLAALTFLSYYTKCYASPIPVQTVPCYCDNSGVITNLTSMQQQDHQRPNDTTADDCDLYSAITAMAAKCQPVRIQYIHVKGHQDRHKDRPLTIPEIHNVECDQVAKQFVQASQMQSTMMPTPEFEAAQPHLIIAGKLVCRRVIPALRQAAATPAYREYLRKRRKQT